MNFHVVTESSFFFFEWLSTYSKQKDPTMRQVVVYKLLRKMENYKTASPKCDRRRLRRVVVYERFFYRALTGNILVDRWLLKGGSR